MSIESVTIWYSSLSTGIFEIDLQHSNIDQLIISLEKSKGDARIQESIDVLLYAIENHFKYEEWRFGNDLKEMNQMHLDEHRTILKKYHHIANIVHVSNAEDIKNEIVGMIKLVLMNHVKDFDCKYFQDAR